MDALGTSVGLASAGIQICQGLLSYYDGWKGYHEDISTTHKNIASLAQTFTILRASLAESTTRDESTTRVETCLSSCTEGLHRLQKRLDKLRKYSEPHGLRQKAWTDIQRMFYPFRVSTLAKLKESVDDLQDNLLLALQTLQQVTLTRSSERTESGISKILQNQQAAKYRSIVDWLSPPDPSHNHHAACKKREPETGEWLLRSGEYKQWKTSFHPSGDNQLLWLTGKAGCGKTVLCSTVIEDIRLQSESTPNSQSAFFYFSYSDRQKQSFAGLLLSLVAQLGRSDVIFDKLQQLYDKLFPNKASTEALEDMLSICLQQGQTMLALDALDELPDGSEDGRLAVMEWISRVMQNSYGLKIFITSRQLVDIETLAMSLDARRILLRPALANSDIQKYLATELEKDPKLRILTADTKEKIREVFQQQSDGMFQWAFCQLEELKKLKLKKPKYIEEVLHRLPPTLDATYERILLQIDVMFRDEALKALRWLAYELRPLTLGELADACLIDYTSESLVDAGSRGRAGELTELLDLLAGLVVIEESKVGATLIDPKARVRLTHFSVQEYLLSDRIISGKAAGFALRKQRDYPILAQECLAYMLYYSQGSPKAMSNRDLISFPLLRYAAEAWVTFIPEHSPTIHEYKKCILYEEACGQESSSIYDYGGRPRGPVEVEPALHYASLLGSIELCKVLLKEGADINAHGGCCGSALVAASRTGHVEVVQLLLRAGADANAQGGSLYGNALQAASLGGHLEVAKRLLRAGADVNAQGGVLYSNALQAASSRGCLKMVQLLLQAGAAVDTKVGMNGNALQAALDQGYDDIAYEILRSGIELDTPGRMSTSTLLALVYGRGNRAVTDLLLKNGTSVATLSRDHLGRSFLHSSARYSSCRGVHFGIEHGMNIDDPDYQKWTPLHWATYFGNIEVVQELLECGADTTCQDWQGWTAETVASFSGYEEVKTILSTARFGKPRIDILPGQRLRGYCNSCRHVSRSACVPA